MANSGLYKLRIEQSVAQAPGVEEDIQKRVAILPKPAVDRNREASFRPVNDLVGNQSAGGKPEKVLALETPDLEVVWQRKRQFDQSMIEEGHARLDRGSHA